MYIDTHFHLDGSDYKEVIDKARRSGVSPLIVSLCSMESIKEMMMVVEEYEDLFVTIGYHPDTVDSISDKDIEYLESLLTHRKVVGLGEIGLDYHYGKENIEKQKKLFRRQIELAIKYNLPVVIHTRDAIQDTYDILKEYEVKGVIHCFSESYEMAKLFLDRGFYFGIGGVLTFKNSKLSEVVRKLPLSNLLLETDSPYLSPDPYRGQVNGPWNVIVVSQKLAEVMDTTVEEVAEVTTNNAFDLFDLKSKM